MKRNNNSEKFNSGFDQCKNMIYKMVLKRWNMMKDSYPNVEFDELLSEGYFIYSWCLKNYDFDSNVKFTTYLYTQLFGRLKDYYDHSVESYSFYSDFGKNNIDNDFSYEENIAGEYDIDKNFKELTYDIDSELSYEAQTVLKFILSRSWETNGRRNKPSNAQIRRGTGYNKFVLDSVMSELKDFFRKKHIFNVA